LRRGTRGVALSLSAELAAFVVISLFGHTLDTDQGSAAFTWAITGLGLGLIASFVRPNFLDASDPQRAYRDAQALIRELIGLSGRLSSGLDPVALGGQIESAVRDELPVAALTVHIPRGELLTPLVGDTGGADPDLAISEELAQYRPGHRQRARGRAQLRVPAEMAAGGRGRVRRPVPGSTPGGWTSSTASALDRKPSPATVRLDTAVLFLAFRDSATVEERRGLARDARRRGAGDGPTRLLVDSMSSRNPRARTAHASSGRLRERLTMVVGEVRRSVQTLRTSIGENDSLGTAIGRWPVTSARAAVPLIHVTLDESTTRRDRGRERAVAHRAGGHDQRGLGTRRPGHQRPVPRRSRPRRSS
jgi:hypothetical protein